MTFLVHKQIFFISLLYTCASFNRATDLNISVYSIGAGQIDYGGSELVQQLLTESEGNLH